MRQSLYDYAAVDNDKETTGNDGKKVISTTTNVYTVKVVTTIDDDRAVSRTDSTTEGLVDEQDVYAGDTVKVEVRCGNLRRCNSSGRNKDAESSLHTHRFRDL